MNKRFATLLWPLASSLRPYAVPSQCSQRPNFLYNPSMQPKNLLYIISDEHRRDGLGCYGHPHIKTPHLDKLARTSVRFTKAYTPSPTCVPARAALHTGQWVHQLGTWSSAEPYEGQATSWAHRLRDAGHRVASIGKLHFRNSHERNGFTEEIVPLHIMNEEGWTHGLLRDVLPSYERGTTELAEQVGAGESSYTNYDLKVTKHTIDWLKQRAEQPEDKPWVAFVSLVSPHYPLIAPQKFYDMYDVNDIDLPIGYPFDIRADDIHPAMKEWYDFFNYNEKFDEARMREARVAYYGLCSFMDDCVGRILDTLNDVGLRDSTRILYTSDHGETLGDHGQWTKMSMYEGSTGVPMILSDVDGQEGTTCDTAANLIDSYQTILDCVGLPLTEAEQSLPGKSLYDIANGADADRVGFSEHHDGGTRMGHFTVRVGDWKLNYFVGFRPQLFNLADDPQELVDLAESPDHQEIVAMCVAKLREIVDPEEADERAHVDQRRKAAALGGREAILGMAGDFGFTPIEE